MRTLPAADDDGDAAPARNASASPAAISADLIVFDHDALDPVRAAAVVEVWRATRTHQAVLYLPLGALMATIVLVAGEHVVVPVAVARLLVPTAFVASAACLGIVAFVRARRFRRACDVLGIADAARAGASARLAGAPAQAGDDELVRLLTAPPPAARRGTPPPTTTI